MLVRLRFCTLVGTTSLPNFCSPRTAWPKNFIYLRFVSESLLRPYGLQDGQMECAMPILFSGHPAWSRVCRPCCDGNVIVLSHLVGEAVTKLITSGRALCLALLSSAASLTFILPSDSPYCVSVSTDNCTQTAETHGRPYRSQCLRRYHVT